ncbi:hypothetical protein PPERSA_09307 [Pseudocohnilembus persalinus]|uniref:Transmembrane protein n=1 Tax=Pseudocohnilembus persalinus TaxID=266149 RepID=A0A0V0R5Z4_PSEPJ|nr:hypothetical protein PPERSA_09307 [Pseudocohnilembus persalinus]|eukprot:KRX09637.1 hypothetical protein PPERSA_09307 [Pseudocohnilembus persalinus]
MQFIQEKKKLFAIGAGIAGISTLLLFLYSRKKQYSKSQIRHILKDLEGQLFSVWIQVADIRNKVVAENNNSTQMNGKNIREILEEQTKQLIQAKKNLICMKHEIQEDDLDYYIDEEYYDDPEIQKIQKNILTCFYNAIDGVKPQYVFSKELLQKFPEEKILYLVEKILRECGAKMVDNFNTLRQQGETDFSISNKSFIKSINKLKLNDLKTDILKKNGFTDVQQIKNEQTKQGKQKYEDELDSPTSLLAKICSKYKQENDTFNEKITALEKKYDVMMDKLIYSNVENQQNLQNENSNTQQSTNLSQNSEKINTIRDNKNSNTNNSNQNQNSSSNKNDSNKNNNYEKENDLIFDRKAFIDKIFGPAQNFEQNYQNYLMQKQEQEQELQQNKLL